MADYHRFVAYIYEYVNGKKMQNTGFAKIELRNAICRIQIHIQNIRMLDGKTEVFGIVRQPKESRKNNPIILLIGKGRHRAVDLTGVLPFQKNRLWKNPVVLNKSVESISEVRVVETG